MSKMSFHSKMPINIALIKYIGKVKPSKYGLNQALHPCLSYTLQDLYTEVALHYAPEHSQDVLLMHPKAPKLAHKDRVRFVDHLAFVKEYMQFDGYFTIDSFNNFPFSAGLASSASSFAALTDCAVNAIESIHNTSASDKLTTLEKAQLSRFGSGSACRSFFGPFCTWDGDDIAERSFKTFNDLQHVVLMFSTEQKHISSSKAHELVRTSEGFDKRQEAVEERYHALVSAFETGDWQSVHKLVWADFIEMHRLFHTSKPSFTYCTPKVKRALEFLQNWWDNHDDGPLVTMDAGSNIHLFFRVDQLYERKRLLGHFADVPMLFGTPVQEGMHTAITY